MARIDGNAPKIPQSIQSLESPKPVVPAGPVAVPVPIPTTGLTGVSDLIGAKARGPNLSGARNKAARMDTPVNAELLSMLKEGMGNSGAIPSSLQLKGGVEAKGETKGGKRSADEIVKSFEGKNRADTREGITKLNAADKKTLLDAIAAGTVTNGTVVAAQLTILSNKDQVALLQNLKKPALDGVKDVWRAGQLDAYPNVQTNVGVEIAARTDWGKANPGPVEALRKAASAGKITNDLKASHDAHATTENGKIQFKPELLENPEATAATFAHEGTHLHQGTTCCGNGASPRASSPQGETDAHLAAIAVWDQLGKKKGNPAGKVQGDLNAQSKRLAEDGPGEFKRALVEGYRNQAQAVIDKQKYGTKPGNTKKDWEAKVKEYDDELTKMKAASKALSDAGKKALTDSVWGTKED